MQFGVKVAERTSKPTNSSGSSDYIRYFRDTETRLRFLEEMDEWTEVWFHFNQSLRRNYPCTGDRNECPGCTSDDERERRAGKKYLVNALQDGYVNLWMLPASTWDDLDRYKDKSGGTILDRDYTIIKHVSDRTTYSVDREERDRIDLAPYESKKKDHQKMLMEAFVNVHGTPGSPREEITKVPKATMSEEYQKVVEAAYKPVAEHSKTAAVKDESKPWADSGSRASEDNDPPPFKEPQSQQDQAVEEDEEQEISEDQLRAMTAPQIKALYAQCGLEAPDTEDVNALADKLIELLS